MSDKKSKKKSKAAGRSDSFQKKQDVSPALPPRPPGGLSRSSMSFDNYNHPTISTPPPCSSLPASHSALQGSPTLSGDTSDVPPPVPSTPRPYIGGFSNKSPASLPPSDDTPPPLPPPLVCPARKASKSPSTHPPTSSPPPSRGRPSTPKGASAPPRGSSTKNIPPEPRYAAKPLETPNISANSVLSEEQLRAQIEMQTQNTAELLEILKGREEESMAPVVLAGKYGKYFPFRVTVMKGFYNNRAEIVAGEVYSVHFLKNARVIAIIDSMNQRYVLPLNAAMRIGFEQENQPPVFSCAMDIITSPVLPKLISPCDNYKGTEGNSFQQYEVMIVKGVHVSRVRRIKTLVVMSVKSSEEKKIPSDCSVRFSTDPMYTQLTLSDAVYKVPDLIPGEAKLYPTVDVEDMGFPGHLVSETVHVKKQYLERSLITTLEELEPRPSDPFSLSTEPVEPTKTIYDIPLSLDIEFSIIPPEPEEDLYAYTHQLSQQFDPRKVQSGDGTGLNMALDEDNIYSGVELELPPYINYNPAAPSFKPITGQAASDTPPPLPARQPTKGADSDDEYTQIDPSLPPPLPTSPSHPPPLPTSLPPTTRPPGAQKDPALPPPLPTTLPPTTRPPGASSPKVPRLSSPKPQQKLPRQVSPPSPKPRPPGVNSRRDSSESDKPEGDSPTVDDDYVDVDDEVQLPPSLPPAPPKSPQHPPPPQLPPTTNGAPPPLTAVPQRVSLASKEGTPPPSSPTSTGSTYDDTADIAQLAQPRPRLPSPVSITETDDSQEMLQQFSDLQSVVQTARNMLAKTQHESSLSHSPAELKRLSDDLKRVSAFPQKILNHCMVLEREVSTLRDMVKDEMVKTSSSIASNENRQFLSSLTVPQVIKMLEMMNMKKYQDKFAQEGIDGAILMEVEEHTLETELGVTSKLDRVKLMKIIKGERSAKSVLEGQYNYVALQPV